MAGDLDKHAGEDEHDGGEDHPTLLEAEGHGQDTHAYGGQFNPFKDLQYSSTPMMELASVMVEVMVMLVPKEGR